MCSDIVFNSKAREALLGMEQRFVDVVCQGLSPHKLAAWLGVPLAHAAACGDLDLAERLMVAGAEIGCALHEAVRGGYEKLVSDMLERGALIDLKDKDGCTPIHIAAAGGNQGMVRILLRIGADSDALDRWERTPLHRAAENGHSAVVKELLEARSNVRRRYGPRELSPLDVAARRGYVEVLKTMIDHGVNVHDSDSIASTALHEAAAENKVRSIEVLIEAGADLRAQDTFEWTPLHRASTCSPDAVLALLKHGANVNVLGAYAQTPLFLAASNAGKSGAVRIVETLLRWGADESASDEDGSIARDVIGTNFPHLVEQDVERVRQLLDNAPADRAWRRRGSLIMCRSRLRSVQIQTPRSLVLAMSRSRSPGQPSGAKQGGIELMNIGEGPGTGEVSQGTLRDSTWCVMAWVLGLEEGVFRTIISFV